MSTIASPVTASGTGRRGAGPLIWQRTDTIGTELVLPGEDRTFSGTAVIAGQRPFSSRWTAHLDDEGALLSLEVTCESVDGRRSLTLTREDGGGWTTRTEGKGNSAAEEGKLDAAVVRVCDSPIFLTWAMRALDVTADGPAIAAATARIRVPSLEIEVGESHYRRLGDHKLRVTGAEPAASYDLDAAGLVTYQAGRLRIVR